MGYLHRREVDHEGAVASMSRLDDIDPSLAVPPPEVSIAATGPRMIAAAARWADGIDFSVGADVGRLRECISLARDACASAGRDPSELILGCFVQVAVTDGEEEMTEAVRGLVITHARFSGNFTSEAASVMEEVLTSSRGGVTPTGKPGELKFYPKEALDLDAVKAFGVIGSSEECAERLAPILELGLAHVYIGTRAVGVDLEEENALRVGRDLLPRLR